MKKEHQLHETISAFLHKLESLQETLPPLMAMAYITRRMAHAKKHKFLKENGELIEETKEGQSFHVKLEHQRLVGRLGRKVERAATAYDVLPSKFLVAFVSEYDAFLGGLLKAIYRLRPELLDGSERSLSFSELKNIGSVEAAYEHVLEKEIETLLRKSHSEQFDWLESKFGLPLKKGLDSWSTFIELTERRNLLVHCDGEISNQYLNVCKKYGVDLSTGIKVGERLETDKAYMKEAYFCLYELGVKLSQVLWRKLLPDDIGAADSSLIDIAYNLIHEEEYELAKRILDFSVCTLKKWKNDSNRRVLVINRAQCYYYSGDVDKCKEILGKEDWTACGDNYRMCVLSLEQKYDDAANVMRRIGASGSIGEADYIDWPVFRDFRSTSQFNDAFHGVFGKDPVNISSLVKEPDIDEVLTEEDDSLKEEILEVSQKIKENSPL